MHKIQPLSRRYGGSCCPRLTLKLYLVVQQAASAPEWVALVAAPVARQLPFVVSENFVALQSSAAGAVPSANNNKSTRVSGYLFFLA